MGRKNISREKIIQAFLTSAFEKSAGATSLSDIAEILEIKKASLYNHFESRDSMYEAALKHCGEQIEKIAFLPENALETIKTNKNAPSQIFKKLVARFLEIYDCEPFFQIYAFVQTEKYFNAQALQIAENEIKKITEDVNSVLKTLAQTEKIKEKSEKEIKDLANSVAAVILQQRDRYIATKKETVRQNPDCGAGSLFALPADSKLLNAAAKLVENLIKLI